MVPTRATAPALLLPPPPLCSRLGSGCSSVSWGRSPDPPCPRWLEGGGGASDCWCITDGEGGGGIDCAGMAGGRGGGGILQQC